MTTETYRNKPLEEKFLRASNHLGWAVILLAAVQLLGWQFNIELLKRPVPNWVAMNPLTAVAFISLNAAFLLLKKQTTRTLSGLGYILATFILLVGLIRLVGVLTGFDLHIDEFLFHQKVEMELTDHIPSRIAPNTAFCIMLMAITLLIFRSVNYRWRIIAQLFCLGVALLALFAIIGYSYQVQEFYKISLHIPMAIQTAVGFLLLSMAILFAMPSEGFMIEFTSSLNGSKVTRNIVPLAIILPFVLGFVRLVAQWEGLITLELGTVALVLSMIFIFLSLVYFEARQLNANDRERLKAEQQLFIKNEWFNQTLVSLGDGVITTDTNGVITLINKAATELTGWQPEEATGTHIDHVFEITNELSGLKVINPVMEALQKNRIVLLANHTILTKKDGSQLFINDSGAPIHDASGKVIGGVLIFRDITQRKKAEEEIIKSELFNRTILESSPDCLKVLDAEGRLLFMNFNGLCQMEIDDFSTFKYKNWWSLWGNENEALVKASIDKALKGETAEFTAFCPTAKGTPKWWEVLVSPVGKPGEPVHQIISVSRDITPRKKTEEVIMASNKRFTQILDFNPVAIVITDIGDNKIKYVNDAFCELSGFEREKILDKPANELNIISQEEGEKIVQDILKASGSAANLESTFRRANGKLIDVLFSVESIEVDNAMCFVGAFIDVTERKKAEEEIKLLNEILEKRVEERTEELIKKNNELTKTNTELDRFAYSTSHDLRSPLTSVLGLLGFIEEETKEPDTLKHASMIRARIKSLDDFIKNILDYSQNNRILVTPVRINFKEIIEQIISGLEHITEKSKINFEIKVDSTYPFYSDLLRLTSVFENLIANAIKYHNLKQEKPFIRINVSTAPGQATITVQDNGIGIAPEHQPKIFEIFYRISGSTPGSGLGLYLVKETIDKLSGTITVQSQINSGTKFLITLSNLKNGTNS